ncbi:MAG: CinA family nicotinamide mononucleotide deamidase-related protein [bacterium]
MKTAGIISVGTEIMFGKIDDTNSTYICRYLKDKGIKVKFRLSVDDNINDMVSAIEHISSVNLVILTGGLGPTDDDITREALSKYLDKKLIFNEEQYQKIISLFKILNRPMPESNRKQAELIDGAEFLTNNFGTAPGMIYRSTADNQKSEKVFVLLPGPPRENQPMIKDYLAPKLKNFGLIQGCIYTKVYRLYNVGESFVAELFKPFKEDVEIGYYFTASSWCEIHLSRYVENESLIKDLSPVFEKAEKIFKDAGVFFTENKDLSLLLLELLEKKGLTVSFAESITGGNISGEFVKNPGASKVFLGGVVSYSNETKKSILGVKHQTLDKHGAVSEEVVKEMAYGLKKITGANIAVSVSGIAGPDGATKDKPVGLVYFGFLFGDKFYSKKELITGARDRIMNRVVNMAFVEILKTLNLGG